MSSDHGLALRVEGLGKRYLLGETIGGFRDRTLSEELLSRISRTVRRRGPAPETLWALRDVSFDVRAGERIGIIGRNGAGKSTLLKILARITAPSEGRAESWGRVGALLEVGTGFHPELTGRENVFLSGAILGMARRELDAKYADIVAFSGVERFMDTPLKRYSSGMSLRLAFAVAAHLEPEILLVDEVLAVGDAEFQRKCLGRMAEIGSQGRTVIFVSHNMPAVLGLCERVIVLEAGGVAYDGRPQEGVARYLDAGTGSAAERVWSATNGPGDDVARLRAVRVRDHLGDVTDTIDVSQRFELEAEYVQLTDDPMARPVVVFQVLNDDGVMLFQTADEANPEWSAAPRRRGAVRTRCRVPANLLAEGRLFVTVTLSTARPYVRHAIEPDAVSFHVVDGRIGTTVAGDAQGAWPGVMRPLLDWDVAALDE